MKVFYNSKCMDSIAAAAVVRHGYPNCRLVSIADPMRFPWETDLMSMKLFFIGLPNVVKTIVSLYPNLRFIWVNVHDEVSKELVGHDIDGLRAPNFGICELAWQYVNELPAGRCPRACRLIGRYAAGDREHDPDTVPFYWGMMAIKNLTPMHPIWNTLLLGDDREEVAIRVMMGRSIREYAEAEEARREAELV